MLLCLQVYLSLEIRTPGTQTVESWFTLFLNLGSFVPVKEKLKIQVYNSQHEFANFSTIQKKVKCNISLSTEWWWNITFHYHRNDGEFNIPGKPESKKPFTRSLWWAQKLDASFSRVNENHLQGATKKRKSTFVA